MKGSRQWAVGSGKKAKGRGQRAKINTPLRGTPLMNLEPNNSIT